MTDVKKTKDSSNEYEAIFVLKHEGLREYFMSLVLKEQVHASHDSHQIKVRWYQEQIYIVPLDIMHMNCVGFSGNNFMLGRHGVKYTDKRTNKAYRFDIE
ncbi:hypothetical protein Ahy_A06g026098 isoform B [Arachis hypogaea]|uniref:Uncharacterized protein n=1 Tax=Arachis hypogaea TaxID=3818 RepID=A0A445CJD3_ARAHY|nr:hypothetical protein Ahy_A06g026098 isoform B [Arachis hypogaea]